MKEENEELKKEGFQSEVENRDVPIYCDAKEYDGKTLEDISSADLEREIFANSKGYQQSKGESSITSEASFFSNKKMKQKKVEDNKQTIADMNVEGMPWHVNLPDEEERLKRMSEPGLTGKETRRLIVNALLATLMVAGVFGLGIFAFILFCVKVWFV